MKSISANLNLMIKASEKASKILPPIPSIGSNTVYLTVVDKDQNIVSFINSIYESFGSGIVPNNTGVILQNRGSSFNLEQNHPNCIKPSKRPMHTIIPALLMKNNLPVMPFGVMGAHYQPVGQAHFLTNVLDYNMDVQEALDNPLAQK